MIRSDLSGRRFGRLTVLSLAGISKHRHSVWNCMCACGSLATVDRPNLTNGNTVSCGCFKVDVNVRRWTRHGCKRKRASSPEYISWASMLARVRSTKGRRFRDYGSRGIQVCKRWEVFENFLLDMGPRPRATSLDRIDNNGNYKPGNCRWATASQQVRNRRSKKEMLLSGFGNNGN